MVLVIWHPLSRQESDQKKNKLKLSYFSETRLCQGGLLGSKKWKIIEKDVLNVYGQWTYHANFYGVVGTSIVLRV